MKPVASFSGGGANFAVGFCFAPACSIGLCGDRLRSPQPTPKVQQMLKETPQTEKTSPLRNAIALNENNSQRRAFKLKINISRTRNGYFAGTEGSEWGLNVLIKLR